MAMKKFNLPPIVHLKSFVQEALSLFLRPENRLMAALWAFCVVAVIAIGFRQQTQTSAFLGIAESREVTINFEFPVVIQRVLVVSGQTVNKGDLIAELDQPELAMKIHSVRAQLEKVKAETALRAEMSRIGLRKSKRPNANSGLATQLDPLASEMRNLQKELQVLEGRERALYVFAQMSGVIGSVNFKKGESVAPYAPLLTIAPAAPTFVQGYIHESLQSRFNVGQKVRVRAVADPKREIEGRIIGLAARIGEFPERMLRVPNQKIWGREINIEIPQTNPFLLGEKVEVGPAASFLRFPIAQAGDAAGGAKTQAVEKPAPIVIPDAVRAHSAFEPSGALYLKDLRKFLVISDDTDDQDSPYLFLLNQDGSLDANLFRIHGLERLQDAESISEDEKGDIYLMASQSRSHTGKDRHDRKLFAQIRRRGLEFSLAGSVVLRDLIVTAARESRNPELQNLSADLEKSMEIEAHFVDQGRLFVGLKSPVDSQGQGFVLDLGRVDRIFVERRIDPSSMKIALRIEFAANGQKTTHITDLVRVGKQLFISTTSKSPGKTGRVWSMNLGTSKIKLLGEYQQRSPEGLAFDPVSKSLLVLFDEGSEPALLTKLSGLEMN